MPEASGPRFRRLEPADAVWVGDELGVLTPSGFSLLSALGSSLWFAAGRWMGVDELTAAAEAELGEHSGAESAVIAALEALEQGGLIERA